MFLLTDQSEGPTVLGIINRFKQGNDSSPVSVFFNVQLNHDLVVIVFHGFFYTLPQLRKKPGFHQVTVVHLTAL